MTVVRHTGTPKIRHTDAQNRGGHRCGSVRERAPVRIIVAAAATVVARVFRVRVSRQSAQSVNETESCRTSSVPHARRTTRTPRTPVTKYKSLFIYCLLRFYFIIIIFFFSNEKRKIYNNRFFVYPLHHTETQAPSRARFVIIIIFIFRHLLRTFCLKTVFIFFFSSSRRRRVTCKPHGFDTNVVRVYYYHLSPWKK